MSEVITLTAIPSQEFNVTLGDYTYDIRIFSTGDSMAYDLSIDDEVIVQGFKFVNGVLMLPYKYMELDGNLLLIVPDDEVPDYNNFESTQFLVYLDADEAETYRDNFDN